MLVFFPAYIYQKLPPAIELPTDQEIPPPESTLAPPRERVAHLWLILLANGLFALLANLLFYFDVLRHPQTGESRWPLIGLGVLVYAVQGALIYFLTRKYAPADTTDVPVRVRRVLWGTGVALLVWLLANGAAALRLSGTFFNLHSGHQFWRFLPLFLFNALPGAFIEEYLFRHLPVRFAEHLGLSRQRTILLFLAVLVFFTLTHIPAYLWQYNNPLWSLWSPFTMGAAYFFVYYATRNLAFVTLFHAFHNKAWMWVGTSDVKDYSLVIIAGILWFFWRTHRRVRQTA